MLISYENIIQEKVISLHLRLQENKKSYALELYSASLGQTFSTYLRCLQIVLWHFDNAYQFFLLTSRNRILIFHKQKNTIAT